MNTNSFSGDSAVDMDRAAVSTDEHPLNRFSLRAVFENSVEAMLLVRVGKDENFRIAEANERASEMYGKPREQLLQAPLGLIFGPHALTEFELLRHTDEAAEGFVFSTTNRRADNEQIPVRVDCVRLPEENGEFFWMAIHDLSGERDSQVLFRTMLESLPVGVVAATAPTDIFSEDLGGEIIFSNLAACTMLQCTDVREMNRLGLKKIMAQADPRKLQNLSGEFQDNGRGYVDNLDLSNIDGGIINVELTMVRVRQGRQFIHLFVFRDRSEQISHEHKRRELEQALLHSQKLEVVGALASGVAHDINNFLTIITGGIGIISGKMPEDELAQLNVANIEKAIGRATELVRHLLGFVRNGNSAETEVPPLEICDSVRKHFDMMETAVGRRVQITLQDDGGPHWVKIKPVALQQILLNLCINARDAMDHSGEIKITLGLANSVGSDRNSQAARKFVLVTVSDNGEGVPEDLRKDIFKPFVTTKKDGKGTGLGLAMVHRLVNQAGGRITYASEVGQGTTFYIHLPVMPQPTKKKGHLTTIL